MCILFVRVSYHTFRRSTSMLNFPLYQAPFKESFPGISHHSKIHDRTISATPSSSDLRRGSKPASASASLALQCGLLNRFGDLRRKHQISGFWLTCITKSRNIKSNHRLKKKEMFSRKKVQSFINKRLICASLQTQNLNQNSDN